MSSGTVDDNARLHERGEVDEHREAGEWLRKNFSEKEAYLQIHMVLIDVLEELRKKK